VLEGEQKTVTALFVDVVGSTGIAERVGPEAMAALMERLFRVSLEEVHRYEGTVMQFLGDGFMALFGAPLAHEDHAERASRAAWGISGRLDVGAVAAPEQARGVLRLRMGIHSGAVIVCTIGDSLRMDYTAVGDTVNLAARLQALAEPGAVYLSEATRQALGPAFDTQPVGTRQVKGRQKPVAVHRLVRVGPPERRRPLMPEEGIGAPLVGRDRERGALLAALAQLCDGRGGLVLIGGEAGVGKSRLVAEARRADAARGVDWLEGRTLSFGREMSYWPFLEILRRWCAIADDDGEPESWAKLAGRVGELFGADAPQVLPYLATLMALPVRGELAERVRYLDSRAIGTQVTLSTHRLVERLAARRPLVLVFEDLHWADASSLELLEHLLPLTGRVPLLVIGLSRPGEEDALPRLRRRVAGAAEQPTEIRLDSLAADESSLLLQHLVGRGALDARTSALLVDRAEGNPFFLEELVRSLIATGALARDAQGRLRPTPALEREAIPETVQGVIMARFDRLEDELKEVLRVAAVVGRVFLQRVLEAISDAPAGLERELDELTQLELIRQRRRLPELEYIFKHVLVQEATYQSILAQRRRELHGQVGACIERLFPERLEEFYGLLAHHYAEAEDWEKTRRYLRLAGDEAGRIAADQEALAYYRRALESFGERLDALERAHLERSIGEALFRLGQHEPAIEHLLKAFSLLGAPYPRSRTALALAIVRQVGRRLLPGRRRSALSTEAAEERYRGHVAMAWMDYFEDPIRMMFDCLASLELAERGGTADQIASGRALTGLMLTHVPLPRLAERFYEHAFREAAACTNRLALGDAHLFFGLHEMCRGRWPTSLAHLDQAEHAYWEGGHLRGWGTAVTMRAWVLRLQGRFSETFHDISRMAAVARDASDRELLAWHKHTRGHTLWRMDELAAAADLLEQAIEDYREIPSTINLVCALADLAECRRRENRLDEALVLLDESADLIKTRQFRGFMVWMTPVVSAEVHLDLAEASSGVVRRRSLRAARKACRQASRAARVVREAAPAALRVRARHDWLRGRRRRAEARWRRSASVATALGARFDLAQTELEAATRLEDGGRRDRALEMLADMAGS